MQSHPENRFAFLDSIRGIAAFFVLFQHAYEHFFTENVREIGHSVFHFGQAGVAAFFLVSGFIIPYTLERSGSLVQFLSNRIFRIYPLYLLVILIQLGLLWLGLDKVAYDVSISRILATHVFFVQEYLPEASPWSVNLVTGSWTLFIEAIWYFLMAGVFYFRISHRATMAIAIGTFAFLIVASYALDIRFPLGRIGMLFNCFLGLHTFRWSRSQISGGQFLAFGIPSLVLVFTGLLLSYGYYYSEHFSAGCLFSSWFSAYALFGLFIYFKRTGISFLDSGLGGLGRISYSVYLSHFTFLILMDYFFGITSVAFAATILSTLVFSAFSYRLVEKPGIDFGKRFWK
jgi:peptidoglycan/LPS O-acetylase OafA/YrhL